MTNTTRYSRPRDKGATKLVLVLDDQPHLLSHWMEGLLGERGFAIAFASSVSELDIWLDRWDGPAPALALIDLDLAEQGGLASRGVALLRDHPITSSTSIAIMTNGVTTKDDRDLRAVMCAYANGGPLPITGKDAAAAAVLPQLASAAQDAADVGARLQPTVSGGGIRLAYPVRLRTQPHGPGTSVLEILQTPDANALWRGLDSTEHDVEKAYQLAFRDRKARDRVRAILNKGELGALVTAWIRADETFLTDGPWLEFEASSLPEGQPTKTRQHLSAFYARYGRLLKSLSSTR
jgi:hypothetical protein